MRLDRTRVPHYIYRCYDADGDLIYIGCTVDVSKRIASHRRGDKRAASRWISVCMARYEVSGPHPGRDAGRKVEAEAIAVEQPIFNIQARRVPSWQALDDIARYLVERGHVDLAQATACTCWAETREAGSFDDWCVAHRQERAA